MNTLLLIGYIVSVIESYYVSRRIIKKAGERDEIEYWGWALFFFVAFASIILSIITIAMCYAVFGEFRLPKAPKFPKWL